MAQKAPKKQCKLCGEEKHPLEFTMSRSNSDGLSTKCKDCIKKTKKRTTIDQIRSHQRAQGSLESFDLIGKLKAPKR